MTPLKEKVEAGRHADQRNLIKASSHRREEPIQASAVLAESQSHKLHDGFSLSRETRMELLRQHGNFSLAYSVAVQPGMSYFGNASGFLAFKRMLGYTFVLGDPIADAVGHRQLINNFLQIHRRPSFVQVSAGIADILREQRFYINEMGYDTRLDLAEYDFSGKEKERFRYAANWLKRRRFKVRELSFKTPPVDLPDLRAEIGDVVEAWRETKTLNRESEFLNRPIIYDDESGVRKFCLLNPKGRVVAFVFFDPIYQHGQVVGYVTAFKRRRPDAPGLAELGITKFAIDQFKSEGIQQVKLGIAPLADLQVGNYRSNPLVRFSMQTGFRSRLFNRFFYNLRGHAEFKSRYRGAAEKTYYATPALFNELRAIAILRLTKVI